MYLLIIVVVNIDYKEEVVLALQGAGIDKATYVNGFNLDKELNEEFPLFTGFFRSKEDREKESMIIFSYVEEKEAAEEFIENLKAAGIDTKDPEILRTYLFEVDKLT